MDLMLLTQAVGELDEKRVFEMLGEFAATHPTEKEAKDALEACQDGISIIGNHFEKGEYSVKDIVFASEFLSKCVEIINSGGFNFFL